MLRRAANESRPPVAQRKPQAAASSTFPLQLGAKGKRTAKTSVLPLKRHATADLWMRHALFEQLGHANCVKAPLRAGIGKLLCFALFRTEPMQLTAERPAWRLALRT